MHQRVLLILLVGSALCGCRSSAPLQPYHARRHTPGEIHQANPKTEDFDAAWFATVEARWYDLVEQRNDLHEETGKVIVKFLLHRDGSISELAVVKSSVNRALSLLCKSAIQDSAPFPPWPEDMRRKVGTGDRKVTITFDYY